MEELSIEEKAKRYDEALERAKAYQGHDVKFALEEIFPELKESEDEKMRRWIINYLDNKALNSGIIQEKTNIKNAIAWLEKQGEQKPQRMVSAEAKEAMYGKPAWSEEDEENLNWFEKFFRAESVIAGGKDIPQDRYLWFKNLKDRVQPQKQWKPTSEQMIALSDISVTGCISYAGQGQELVNLYNDLNKLKG